MTTAASLEPSLVTEAATFLEADGWIVSLRDPSFIVGSRQGLGEVSDQVLVWVPQEGLSPEQLRRREDGYLRRFEEAARTYGYGQKYLLVESTEGLSADFRRRAFREFGVTLTVTTDFFDAPFKWDRSRTAATAANALRIRGQQDLEKRIAQPFTSSHGHLSHEDLLQELLPEFRPSASGPAGAPGGRTGRVRQEPPVPLAVRAALQRLYSRQERGTPRAPPASAAARVPGVSLGTNPKGAGAVVPHDRGRPTAQAGVLRMDAHPRLRLLSAGWA